jgi:hypothetical protein
MEQATPPKSAGFPWPRDAQAWWSVFSCLAGGWVLIVGLRLDTQALALAVVGLGLFFSSDWLSHLAGRSREGDVHPADWDEPAGLSLLGLTAASLAYFLLQSSGPDRHAWATVVTGVGCLVALMFVLRLEWRPLDGRLLYLTHVILTLPALVFGFTVWGVGSPEAFMAWALPAVYFPAQALFAHYWMEGTDAPGSSLSVLAAPLLGGVLLQAWRGGWVAAAFLSAFLLRCLWQLQRRRLQDAGLPGFAAIRRLSLELQAWNVAALGAWGVASI